MREERVVEERIGEWERGDIVGERRFHLEIRDNGSDIEKRVGERRGW